jgi:hypothetical protein
VRENARTIVQALDVVNTFVQDSLQGNWTSSRQPLTIWRRSSKCSVRKNALLVMISQLPGSRDIGLCRARNECSSLNPNHFLRPDGDAEPVPFYERARRGEELFLFSDFICQS